MRHFILAPFIAISALGLVVSPGLANDGQTIPKPVFQLGDTPSQPLPEGGEGARNFVEFFNNTYQTGTDAEGEPLPKIKLLSKGGVVWFPPQRAGDTSYELVSRAVDGGANCTPGDPGFPPQGYPLVCETGEFSTAQFCQACHDSALFVEGGGIPEMMYVDEHEEWFANWSQYGDWSATIMRLATRDPIWQAQIETETNVHAYADPHVIQDVCFSCHGEMGERQLKVDIANLLKGFSIKNCNKFTCSGFQSFF